MLTDQSSALETAHGFIANQTILCRPATFAKGLIIPREQLATR